MADKLFGTLQTPLKPINYTGLESETTQVIVDSKERTIQVDVKSDIIESIEHNIRNLENAQIQLRELNSQISELEDYIDNLNTSLEVDLRILRETCDSLDSRIDTAINTFEADIQQVQNNIENILTDYATKDYVENSIEDKILELQEGNVELSTYAKKADVQAADDLLNQKIETKLDIDDFEQQSENILSDIQDIGLKIDVLEAKIGPLSENITLKEEIDERYATKEAVASLQKTSEDIYAKKLEINSYIDNYIDAIEFIEAKIQ